ncbi:HIT family protein [Sediminibacillus albus]|uniref:Histidine triad (HIT) family protein n=1 Tax=Sediminibacillus albus TaxID=407036 RepID=A0A1G8XEA4_9BACI|nr:HIT family protein [Sediminibacillus albus]SDJ88694.1 histidine triad (HIT) family protein [Sediminibacillus albus]
MNHSEDCIFCKIVAGDIPSAKVYEDENVYAFLDLSQVTKGHTLVIPKHHTRNIYETPPEVAQSFFGSVPKVASAIKEAFQPVGLNLLNNNEEAAGQSVFHLHIHLIPRYGKGDGFEAIWNTNNNAYSQDDLQQIAGTIGNYIKK